MGAREQGEGSLAFRQASLARRVFWALLAVSVVAAVVATVASALVYQSGLLEDAADELRRECDAIASALDAAEDEVAELALFELDDVRATIVAPDGSVVYDSLVAPSELPSHATRPEVIAALEVGSGSSMRASDTLGVVGIYRARRLASGNVLRLAVDRSSVLTILFGDLEILAFVLVGLAVVSHMASRMLSARLVKPILEIDSARLAGMAPYRELQPLTDRLALQQAELVEQMEGLRNADALRREFTANVTHELKTPIASIMGASELIRDGFVLEEDIPDFASRINDEAQRLSALVNDILMLSRLDESERVRSQESFGAPVAVDLFGIARDIVGRYASRADEAGVELVVEGEHTLVMGYARILDELISNLCGNAIRYNVADGSARVWVGMRDGKPTVEVSDTGIGIPGDAQGQVFERFYRVEPSRSRASGGTGLGLAIVKHAAALHGADVELNSVLGEGTSITVSFPAVKLGRIE